MRLEIIACDDRMRSVTANERVRAVTTTAIAKTVDVRVGRHRDKLELIRDSLRPFEQTVGDVVPMTVCEHYVQHGESQSPSVVDSTMNCGVPDHHRAMVDSLMAKGYDQDAAFYALKLVKFTSTAAAVDVLKHINHDHANVEEKTDASFHDSGLCVFPNSGGQCAMNGNHVLPTSVVSAANGVSNGNLYAPQFVANVEDSSPSRSSSPLPPQMPAGMQSFVTSSIHMLPSTSSVISIAGSTTSIVSLPSTVSSVATSSVSSNSSPHKPLSRQFTPITPEYPRTHVHISSTTPYTQDFYQQQIRCQKMNYNPSIFMERSSRKQSGSTKQQYVVRDAYRTPLDSSISAPIGQTTTSHAQIGAMSGSHMMRYGQQPQQVVGPTISSTPLMSVLNINGSPMSKATENRIYRLDVSGRDGVSSVHGIPSSVTGVQNIVVDPDKSHRSFVDYDDDFRHNHTYVDIVPSTSKEQSHTRRHDRLERAYTVSTQNTSSRTESSQPVVNRCTSPLPESISNRLKQQKYERYVKPCKPRMFCFFMEQHVERLQAQYKERMKRAHQLQREMEAANLPEPMKQKMLDFLQQKESRHKGSNHRYMRLRRQKMNKDMFEVLQHIGVGAFGRVSLVKKKDSGQVYAMKSLLKQDVIMKQQAAHVKAERDILAEADSPWIVKLFFSFQDDRCLYFVMEYVPGGDMMQLLINKGIFEEKLARLAIMFQYIFSCYSAAHVKAERDILAEADSPWIVKLFFSFQDDRCLYFVMEYVPGGDMMQLLINKGIFEEKLARFYIAELTCAIDYVHSLGFIHRDIKPDNILIDQHGHIKLTDFGLCTGLRWTHDRRYYGPENDSEPSHVRVDSFSLPPDVSAIEPNMKVLNIRHQKKRDQAHSVVGTGNYMAPEVILKIGHTQLCDWWSVGVILYEMVFGRPPFMSLNDDASETQYKIINWSRFLDVSSRAGGGHLSCDCILLIQRLCCDRSNRIGLNGAREVMDHPWFRGIDFKNLRSTRAEFIPRVEHAEDTSNFEAVEISESPFETLGKRAPNNPAFYEFTFRHFFDTDGQGCPSLRPPQKRPPLAPLFEGIGARHEAASSSESIVI
ncbi:kinase domain protein [Dictyocaulus viviparus]|uniref:non-specific serine/threonine protein kinase n=1 Tax=Dictyocaulus viviparus TaxID=29172 RepID=A0A0D8Y895_DICVI|nr:kinase domain protein [Dictyocaulus viviparus]